MKPVAIFRHAATEGPGYFATYLERRGIPWRMIRIDEGAPVPEDPGAYSGLAFLGGPMSANDDLPWIPRTLALIRAAVDRDVPSLGHCLGGQLIAKALGAEVTRNPVKEIGWGPVEVLPNRLASSWFGSDLAVFECFHWHGETFSIPASATRVLESPHCRNQAFVQGPHLAMQCHVEMTPDLVRAWCREWGKEVESLASRMPTVQAPASMLENLEARTAALNAVADRIYGRWVRGFSPGSS